MESIMKYSRWMSDLPQWVTNVPISCLAIPGSHNSGTRDLDPALGTAVDQTPSIRRLGNSCCGQRVVHRWSKTQNLSISEQLHAGVRYFDFRVAVHPDTMEFRFVHGLYGGLVPLALRDINTFLNQNPYEVVILDFNHFYNMNQTAHHMLLAEVRNVFGHKSVPPPFSTPNYKMWGTSLRALWQTPYRVITIYHDDNIVQYPEIWAASTIESPWANTGDLAALIRFLETNYSNKLRYKNDCLYSWQGILTPSHKHIAFNLGSSLEGNMASKATREFVKWLKSGKVPGPQGINICIADFIEKHDFIQTVVGLNQTITEIPTTF
ncbi:PI-PLC X domain-containing protein 2-like [Mercenaria mercenaria]|uniref:PI-PLC X domain-containing protein 2-like n=1 Tax=Mercenaria mercenaria TaxID=6596 RepID=UPI00234E7163|nr:PI-PLC X domain-containing protein 2-like [Mercenaria mercenaria]